MKNHRRMSHSGGTRTPPENGNHQRQRPKSVSNPVRVGTESIKSAEELEKEFESIASVFYTEERLRDNTLRSIVNGVEAKIAKMKSTENENDACYPDVFIVPRILLSLESRFHSFNSLFASVGPSVLANLIYGKNHVVVSLPETLPTGVHFWGESDDTSLEILEVSNSSLATKDDIRYSSKYFPSVHGLIPRIIDTLLQYHTIVRLELYVSGKGWQRVSNVEQAFLFMYESINFRRYSHTMHFNGLKVFQQIKGSIQISIVYFVEVAFPKSLSDLDELQELCTCMFPTRTRKDYRLSEDYSETSRFYEYVIADLLLTSSRSHILLPSTTWLNRGVRMVRHARTNFCALESSHEELPRRVDTLPYGKSTDETYEMGSAVISVRYISSVARQDRKQFEKAHTRMCANIISPILVDTWCKTAVNNIVKSSIINESSVPTPRESKGYNQNTDRRIAVLKNSNDLLLGSMNQLLEKNKELEKEVARLRTMADITVSGSSTNNRTPPKTIRERQESSGSLMNVHDLLLTGLDLMS